MRCANGFLPFLCLACCGESAHDPVASRGNDWPTLRADVSSPAASCGQLSDATRKKFGTPDAGGVALSESECEPPVFSMSNSPVRGTYEREYDK